mmetsp:Transcript_37250/g.45483  ORF Transcript_37250/g.45483 Transcript_37250/m.45483 type:complete len:131 (-) Transcript_37250:314-706(-)
MWRLLGDQFWLATTSAVNLCIHVKHGFKALLSAHLIRSLLRLRLDSVLRVVPLSQIGRCLIKFEGEVADGGRLLISRATHGGSTLEGVLDLALIGQQVRGNFIKIDKFVHSPHNAALNHLHIAILLIFAV